MAATYRSRCAFREVQRLLRFVNDLPYRLACLENQALTPSTTALERTYLAWVRTSVKFAHFGVIVTQLFRLPKEALPSSPLVSEFYRLGRPLGLVSISLAVIVILVGGFRCWQQQQYMTSGKVLSCGREIWTVVLLTLGVSCHFHYGFPGPSGLIHQLFGPSLTKTSSSTSWLSSSSRPEMPGAGNPIDRFFRSDIITQASIFNL